jgi:threonine aldolase
MARHFGAGVQAFPVFNGTGANVLSLQSVLPRWGAVVCAETAHINTDENGAPERVGALKLLTVATSDGKLTPELIDRQAWGWGDEHRAQPLAVSITQTTELGTAYTPQEVRAIADHVHSRNMVLHVDGARIANAVFAVLDPAVADQLRQVFRFYDWNTATGEVRWMCSFDTTEADVDAFVGELKRLLAQV